MLTRTAAGATTAYTYTGEGEDPAKAQVGTGTPTYYAYSPSGPLATRQGDHRLHTSLLHPRPARGRGRSCGHLRHPQMKGSILLLALGSNRATTTGGEVPLGFQGDPDGRLHRAGGHGSPGLRAVPRPLRHRGMSSSAIRPVRPSLSQFVYAGDAPVTFTDPTGMMPINDPQCSRACNSHYCIRRQPLAATHPATPTLPLPNAPRVSVQIPGPSRTVGLVTWSLSGSYTGPDTGSPWTIGLSDRGISLSSGALSITQDFTPWRLLGTAPGGYRFSGRAAFGAAAISPNGTTEISAPDQQEPDRALAHR